MLPVLAARAILFSTSFVGSHLVAKHVYQQINKTVPDTGVCEQFAYFKAYNITTGKKFSTN